MGLDLILPSTLHFRHSKAREELTSEINIAWYFHGPLFQPPEICTPRSS